MSMGVYGCREACSSPSSRRTMSTISRAHTPAFGARRARVCTASFRFRDRRLKAALIVSYQIRPTIGCQGGSAVAGRPEAAGFVKSLPNNEDTEIGNPVEIREGAVTGY